MRIADQILHLCGHVWLDISGRCSPSCTAQKLGYHMPPGVSSSADCASALCLVRTEEPGETDKTEITPALHLHCVIILRKSATNARH